MSLFGHAEANLRDLCSKEVICEQPLLTVDKQMGLNIVHPEGKVTLFSSSNRLVDLDSQPAKTAFNRLFYDSTTDTSVLHCERLTHRYA